MGREDEVIPDSQDEGEGHPFQASERDLSPLAELPLTNPTIPRSSSSYMLPQPKPILPSAPSTISQFTMETAMNTEIVAPSTISTFSSSSAAKKSRPRPRPTYAGAMAAKDSSVNITREPGYHITSPSVTTSGRISHILPPPQATFSPDISERIKARRAPSLRSSELEMRETQGTSIQTKERFKKKTTLPVEEVIEINSDSDIPASISRSSTSQHSIKTRDPPRSPDPLNIIVASPPRLLRRDPETDAHDMSPLPARKRKRPPMVSFGNMDPSTIGASSASGDADASGSPLPSHAQKLAPPPKKKKKSEKVDNTGERISTEKPKKSKKKSQAKDQEPKKARVKPQGKEKEQFKSGEFIMDSDDELSLRAEGVTSVAEKKLAVHPGASAAAVVASALVAASSKISMEAEVSAEEPVLGTSAGGSTKQQQEVPTNSKAKKTSRKRKAAREDTPDTSEDRPLPKKAKRPDENAEESTKKQLKRGNDNSAGAGFVDKASTKQGHDASDAEESIVKPMRKKSSRVVIEDEESDAGAKENEAPASTKALTASTSITPVSAALAPQPLLSTPKASYAYPPKNRPLSSILQRVNGPSPRLRGSPSMSRNLLTRIAPLHPNRRTPPPPPPPRIIPKKTKKELEREEKWEEELQETVEGWCELEEGERERMRRAKRDWELGLCEE